MILLCVFGLATNIFAMVMDIVNETYWALPINGIFAAFCLVTLSIKASEVIVERVKK